MAKAGTLTSLGKILGLIGGILAIVRGVAHILDQTIDEIANLGSYGGEAAGGDTVGAIVVIVIGIITVMICLDRYQLKDPIVLGVVLIVLGLLGSGLLAIIGGILAILDALL